MRRFVFYLCIALYGIPSFSQDHTHSTTSHKKISRHTIEHKHHSIHYAQAGVNSQIGLLFVHGTPGDWTAFEGYLNNHDLQRDFFMVSVDRLGWGDSSKPRQDEAGSFDLQAHSIGTIISQYPQTKWLIVGHSLGASIAPKIAYLYPDKVAGLLLLAGSLVPKYGKPKWYNFLANFRLANWLLPADLKYSNNEIMALRQELTKLEAELQSSQLNTRVFIMQGGKDKLVSPKNPSSAAQSWQANFEHIEIIEIPQEGHFLPWRQTDLVLESIYRLSKSLPAPSQSP
jgi:pimeloyl-ACP methyl ester carboxylesterase